MVKKYIVVQSSLRGLERGALGRSKVTFSQLALFKILQLSQTDAHLCYVTF